MRRTAISAVILTLVSALPAGAGGYVGAVFVSHEEQSGFGDENETLRAAAAFGIGRGAFGFQADAGAGNLSYGEFLRLNGHAYWQRENLRVGAVISFTNAEQEWTRYNSSSRSEYALGIEGSMNVGDELVLSTSATMGNIDYDVYIDPMNSGILGLNWVDHYEHSSDTWNADIGASYYPTPNIKLNASFGVGENSGAADVEPITNFSIGAEIQPFDIPWSVAARYQVSAHDYGPYFGQSDVETISVGIRWNFGAETLRERDKSIPFDGTYGFSQHQYDMR